MRGNTQPRTHILASVLQSLLPQHGMRDEVGMLARICEHSQPPVRRALGLSDRKADTDTIRRYKFSKLPYILTFI